MKNTLVLEMINNGEIEELKALLQNEIYTDSLKGNGDSKKRYKAMERYIKAATNWTAPHNNMMHESCKVTVRGEDYYCFLDGFNIALTTEPIGQIPEYDNSKDTYFKVDKMITFDGTMERLNLNSILAEAKSKGYKWKKSELGNNGDFKYLFKYKDGYFKIGLLDMAYSIVNDGEEAEVYYINNKTPITIKTSVGIALVLPVNAKDDIEKNHVVIDVEKNQEAV